MTCSFGLHWGLVLALAGCSAPERGALEPVAAPGIALAQTHGLPNDTARLIEGGVTADVTGAWSNRGESVEIAYRAGAEPGQVAIVSSATWKERVSKASAAWDRTVAEPGNALGRPLLGGGPLRLVGNTRRVVQIEYDRSAEGDRPGLGDDIVIAVPMPAEPRPVRFRLGGE